MKHSRICPCGYRVPSGTLCGCLQKSKSIFIAFPTLKPTYPTYESLKETNERPKAGNSSPPRRTKLNLRPGPDAALIFMRGIGIPPRAKKSRVENGNGRLPCVHHR
jgi:hypothetical protein